MKKLLLLVDDEESIRILYSEEFKDDGYDVMTAENGHDALEIFNEKRPDLVILDIQMPDMDGIDVLRKMKMQDSTVPVILSTAYQDYKQELGTWASDEYIVKSANLGDLKAAVIKHLGSSTD